MGAQLRRGRGPSFWKQGSELHCSNWALAPYERRLNQTEQPKTISECFGKDESRGEEDTNRKEG